jgi:hypothetical protein
MNIGFNAVTKRIFLNVSDHYTARFGRLLLQRIPVHFFLQNSFSAQSGSFHLLSLWKTMKLANISWFASDLHSTAF